MRATDLTDQPDIGPETPIEDQTMSFYNQDELPFYYGLAQDFALSDRHFASTLGPTFPNRAYLNAVEAFAPFAALVVVAHLAGKANAMTAFWATAFFWLRLAHAVVFLLAIPYIRTVLFTLGFVAVAGIFWEVIK